MLSGFVALIRRDLRLALRQGLDSMMALAFFVLACVLFPFGVGPGPELLSRIAPGILWVAALLAALLSLERLFQDDYQDGSLELLATGPLPLAGLVAAKAAAHWLTTAVPLIAAAPLLAVLLHLPGEAFAAMLAALALGTPSLSLIGAVGAALVLGARRSGVLLALLVLPLYIPVLIFGAGAIDAAQFGLAVRPHLLMLGAMALAASVLAPLAAASALRQALD
jgi:heme exporter protein B